MTDKERRRKNYEEKWKPAYDAWIVHYPFTTESLDGEIWLPVPNFEDYHGSNFGRVKSFKNGNVTIKKPSLDDKGYLRVQLYKNGKQKLLRVHILVATLFIPNPENKPEVNHDDGVKFNCHVSNLVWATSSENKKHAVATGLHKSGEESYQAKLTNEQVIYIRENPDGLNIYQLAEKFNMAFQTISEIQRGIYYKDAGGKIREKIDNRTPDEIRAKILADYQPGVRGCGCHALAKKYGRHPTTINRIVTGKSS